MGVNVGWQGVCLAEGLSITVAWGIAPGNDAEMRTDWPEAIFTC